MPHGLRLRIAIADDHALFRQGLKSMLALSPDVEVVAETDKADGLAPMLDAAPCDILLLDLQMDRSSLIEIGPLTRRAKIIVFPRRVPSPPPTRFQRLLAWIRYGSSGTVASTR